MVHVRAYLHAAQAYAQRRRGGQFTLLYLGLTLLIRINICILPFAHLQVQNARMAESSGDILQQNVS